MVRSSIRISSGPGNTLDDAVYASLPHGATPKLRLAVCYCRFIFRRLPDSQERTAILSSIIKVFFLPLLVVWAIDHLESSITHLLLHIERGTFFPNGYWLAFNFLLLVDVVCFSLGYALEHPALKNEIKSVDSSVLGWVVVFACYPPFNHVTNQMLGWYSSDYPMFESDYINHIAGILMLILLGIYAWASLSLNLKASNLTNRGIVSHGPYAWVRHPAYIAKNVAWWIGSFPILAMNWNIGPTNFLMAFSSILGWSFIYYLRAITEERHLSNDPEYQRYCNETKQRFFPKLKRV